MKKFLSIALFASLIACKKSEHSPATAPSSTGPDHLYTRLVQLGFKESSIKDLGKYYLVEGDMLFDKEHTDMTFFENYFKAFPKDPAARHWVTNDQVSAYNIESIKIETDEYSNNGEITDWRRSSALAMQHWAGISNCNINFVRYFNTWGGPRYINILDDGGALDNYTIAAAEWPTSGNPGFQIRVNLDYYFNKTVPESQRVYNLVHEMGHCFGFRHTDLGDGWESSAGASPVLTTSSTIDYNSVMRAGTAENTWNGFSADDITAAQTIYGPGAYANWITAPNSGQYPSYAHYFVYDVTDPIQITWNASLVATSTVTLQVYQNGTYMQTIASGIPNNGSYYSSQLFTATTGTSGASSVYEVQVKIIADDNPSIFDFSTMFDIDVD